jgi:glycosyltransferase involved in cell wall biosynthesis
LVGKDPSFEPVVTFSINESDGVTAVSESLKNDTYEEFEIISNIQVIPNFIDLERFKNSEKTILKLRYVLMAKNSSCIRPTLEK